LIPASSGKVIDGSDETPVVTEVGPFLGTDRLHPICDGLFYFVPPSSKN
jgi:hypothetical protein